MTPIPPNLRPGRAFVWPVRVYWEDTDAGGIEYHANHFPPFLQELDIEH